MNKSGAVAVEQFDESERKRQKAEQQRQDEKHRRQYDQLLKKNNAAVRELEQLQVRSAIVIFEGAHTLGEHDLHSVSQLLCSG